MRQTRATDAKQVEVTNEVQNGSANSVDFKKEPKKTKKCKGSKCKKTVAKETTETTAAGHRHRRANNSKGFIFHRDRDRGM